MTCATGFYNGNIRPSHFYDVCRNPNYWIGKQLSLPFNLHWLRFSINELYPTLKPSNLNMPAPDLTMNSSVTSTPIFTPSSTPALKPVSISAPASPLQLENAVNTVSDQMIYIEDEITASVLVTEVPFSNLPQRRPLGAKDAKAAKKQKFEKDSETLMIKNALEEWKKATNM